MTIKDSLYMKAKELYVARMRIANDFKKSDFGKLIYKALDKLNNILRQKGF